MSAPSASAPILSTSTTITEQGKCAFNCNGGLGQFGDDEDRLLRAAEYLHGAGVVLEHAEELRNLSIARAEKLVARTPG